MKIKDRHYRTIWIHPENPKIIQIIDQTKLPFQFVIEDLTDLQSSISAIKNMQIRGAGLIGATAAFGVYLASLDADAKNYRRGIAKAGQLLSDTRPTAVNLQWAVNQQMGLLERSKSLSDFQDLSFKLAKKIADEDAGMCKRIGEHGLKIIEKISRAKPGKAVNILTHCNAGWLAFVDYGSATSPIYLAHDKGIDVHVWVDETRPRNQGARLTAWELLQHGVNHTIIPDNTGGHLMQHGLVDLVITGADRVTRSGDVANKIGTYLKALAAKDNDVPFYVALPSSTFDWDMSDGIKEIPIELRDSGEVKFMSGWKDDREDEFLITPGNSPVANYGFDVTPARLITGLITEKGICKASESSIHALFKKNNGL